jgi:hypothetical protein
MKKRLFPFVASCLLPLAQGAPLPTLDSYNVV